MGQLFSRFRRSRRDDQDIESTDDAASYRSRSERSFSRSERSFTGSIGRIRTSFYRGCSRIRRLFSAPDVWPDDYSADEETADQVPIVSSSEPIEPAKEAAEDTIEEAVVTAIEVEPDAVIDKGLEPIPIDGGELIDIEDELHKEDGALGSIPDDPYLQFPFLVDPTTIRWIHRNHIVIITRGLPGSGKSTLVRAIVAMYPEAVVCSADHFFIDAQSGEYVFNPKLLKDAHAACQSSCERAMAERTHVIVVDNTNVLRWEMKTYFIMAMQHEYRVILAEPKTPWKFDAFTLAAKNTHGVSAEVIKKKVKAFEVVPPMYYAWFLDAEDSEALMNAAAQVLRTCLEVCEELREDFARFSSMINLPSMMSHYSRKMCVGSAGHSLHCTAKFCGMKGGKEYAQREEVVDALGRVEDLRVTGFVVARGTFGARVKLNEKQLNELYDQRDTETIGAKVLSVQRGGRAHITIGTAEGVKPVTTGLDVMEAVGEGAQGALVEGVGEVKKVRDGLWAVELEKELVWRAMFTGHY